MKTEKYGKVEIPKELADEFAECLGCRSLTPEQQQLILTFYADPDCIKSRFAKMFRQKYGFGSRSFFARWLKQHEGGIGKK